MTQELKLLKQYALDNYEAGGHWVFETYSDADYAEVLRGSQSIDAAKESLKRDWELCEERKQECSWA